MLSLPLPWLHPTPTRSLEGGRAGLRWGYREGGDTQSPKFPLPSRVSPLGFPRPRSPRSAGRGACPGDSTEPWWLEQARYLDGASWVRVSPRVSAPGDSVLGAWRSALSVPLRSVENRPRRGRRAGPSSVGSSKRLVGRVGGRWSRGGAPRCARPPGEQRRGSAHARLRQCPPRRPLSGTVARRGSASDRGALAARGVNGPPVGTAVRVPMRE